MEYTEDLKFRAELLQKIRDREFSERTGVHFSDLNYCLNKQVLRKKDNTKEPDQTILMYSLGWATQRWLTGNLVDAPTVEKDGIQVTCDDLMGGEPWELKATFQSSNKPILDNAHWVRQLKAQCYVQNSLRGYLTRFEIMGDWKSIFKPKEYKTWDTPEQLVYDKEHTKPTLHAYRFDFTQQELDALWQWLLERKELYLQAIESGELLPKAIALPPSQTWECGYCDYVEECEACQ